MSEQALIKMIYAAASDAGLKSGLLAAITPEQKATCAMKHGFEVNAEDFESLALRTNQMSGEREISDSDLSAVAGGTVDGISRLIAVTQMKANNADDDALQAAALQSALLAAAKGAGGAVTRHKP